MAGLASSYARPAGRSPRFGYWPRTTSRTPELRGRGVYCKDNYPKIAHTSKLGQSFVVASQQGEEEWVNGRKGKKNLQEPK